MEVFSFFLSPSPSVPEWIHGVRSALSSHGPGLICENPCYYVRLIAAAAAREKPRDCCLTYLVSSAVVALTARAIARHNHVTAIVLRSHVTHKGAPVDWHRCSWRGLTVRARAQVVEALNSGWLEARGDVVASVSTVS